MILEDNNIEDIHPETFITLSKIRLLDLKRNKLTSVLVGMLRPSLEFLDISYQCLSFPDVNLTDMCSHEDFRIAPGVFINMTNLQVLKMSGLHLNTIKHGSFTGLSNLQELLLDNTDVTRIADDTFDPLKELRTLDLSFNDNLKGFTANTFSGLSSLRLLDLSYSSHVFMNTDQQESADSYFTSVMSSVPTLRVLILRCTLAIYCQSNYNFTSPPSAISMLNELTYLDLSLNDLSSWEDDRFVDNPNLQVLFLSGNGFSFISHGNKL